METAGLKAFATWARSALIGEVSARVTAVLAPGAAERVEEPQAVAALEKAVAAAGGDAAGRAAVADRVAYTWFNRVIALRFMDANGYTGVGVVSPQSGVEIGQPEILADAKRGVLDTEVVGEPARRAVVALLDGTRASGDPQGEAYSLLLAEYCRFWNRAMPFMFEKAGDFTELLIPANLLADDSVLNRAVKVLTADVCADVEVIGWLYQFYISERKDEVFAGFKKNKKAGAAEIPAATQLFTPHWIVRYLVENSVGRLWMLNHPSSGLVDRMDYYIAPVDEETDFLKIARPEDLTVIDPACGSGHMLTYAFDLLYAIYEEEGYAPTDIPGLILTHNLYGTEIDHRAGALASFALTMKARGRQRTFFNSRVEPNICVLCPITFTPGELGDLATEDGDRQAEEAFWTQFAHADTFGSLIRPDPELTTRLADYLATLDDRGGMFRADVLERATGVIEQATYLTRRYSVAVANPPYMGSKQMNPLLSQFMKREYPTGKSDLMAAFMVRSGELTVARGTWAMINLPSWMSLKSFEELRHDLLRNQRLVSMVHLGRGVFGSDFGTVAFAVDNAPAGSSRGVYRRLFEQHVDVRSVAAIEALFLDPTYNRFEVSQRDFAAIPGSPIVYWLSEKMRAVFTGGRPLRELADAQLGMRTGDNGKYLRLWWEVSGDATVFEASSAETANRPGQRWVPYNKGGSFRKWSGNRDYVVLWENNGYAIKEDTLRKYPQLSWDNLGWKISNESSFFKPSISWSKVSSGSPAFRGYGRGFIFDVAGTSFFPKEEDRGRAMMGICNSSAGLAFLQALSPTMNFEVGQIAVIPVVMPQQEGELSGIVDRLVETASTDWDCKESAWGFSKNPLIEIFQRD